jgi:hypothetical protein
MHAFTETYHQTAKRFTHSGLPLQSPPGMNQRTKRTNY